MTRMAANYKRLTTTTPDTLFPGHDGCRPPAVDVLAGTTHELHFAGAAPVSVTFEDSVVHWRSDGGINGRFPAGSATYEAVEAGDGLLIIVIEHPESRSNAFVLWDANRSRVLLLVSEVLGGTSSVAESSTVWEAGVGGPLAFPFEPTDELLGKRIHWTYSETHKFEHIYLEPELYVWHGLNGPEKNMAAVEPALFRKITNDVYFFAWSDLAIPFSGALVIDLRGVPRSTGRLASWDDRIHALRYIVVGADGQIVNDMDHR